jgi:hypothetical protein
MSGYFLHAREKRGIQKFKLAMGVGNSNHYNFDKIWKRHYLKGPKESWPRQLVSKKFAHVWCPRLVLCALHFSKRFPVISLLAKNEST